jgi:hypothetical protein
MSSVKAKNTTVEYPITRTFEGLFDELVERAEEILDIANRLKKYPRHADRFYEAMADLYAIVVILPILGKDLEREMNHLNDLFPEEEEA